MSYCKELINAIKKNEKICGYPKVQEKLNLLEETVSDNLEHLETSKDRDARTGHKTADTSFFGYKTHIAMTEERIITAATVTSGEKTDGKELPALVRKSRDAGMYQCKAGHLAIHKYLDKRQKEKKNKNPRMVYFFDVEKCRCCPYRAGCYKEGAKKKTYSEALICDAHSEQARFQETEYFKKKAKERYKIEAKNNDLKHRHGYDTASSSGLIGMEMQGAMAIFAVNLKRIIKLINE